MSWGHSQMGPLGKGGLEEIRRWALGVVTGLLITKFLCEDISKCRISLVTAGDSFTMRGYKVSISRVDISEL